MEQFLGHQSHGKTRRKSRNIIGNEDKWRLIMTKRHESCDLLVGHMISNRAKRLQRYRGILERQA